MGITDFIPKAFKKKEIPTNSNFLTITLLPTNILALVWKLSDSQNVQIEGFSQKQIKETENIIHETAAAIDDAAQKTQGDLQKVVFGLCLSYFEDDHLKTQTSKLLKDIADNLELTAQAFISLPSAINHHLKAEEQVTPHAVLIGVFEGFCEISLIEKNKVQKSKTFAHNADLDILNSAIRSLKTENTLPSRMIVYGIEDDDKFAHSIAKHDWSEIFIHAPKITFLKNKELAKSIAYSQAADILGHEVHTGRKDENPTIANAKIVHAKPDSFGFAEGEDIQKTEKDELPIEENEQLTNTNNDEKSQQSAASSAIKSVPHNETAVDATQEKEYQEVPRQESARQFADRKKSIITKFRQELFTLSWLSRMGNIFQTTSKRNLLVAAAIIAIAAVIVIFVLGQFFSQVELVVKVKGLSQDTDFKVLTSTDSQLDLQKAQIPGVQISEQGQSKQSATTTGIKKIGQKASGEVTVFNWTTNPKTFAKETTIISKSGIKFSLTSDVDVASRSASTPGQSKVTVSASTNGESGNLSGGTDFTFQQFDELLFSAHSDNPMTGGSEKQITVVSQDDLAKLEKSTKDALTEQLKATLKSKNPDKKLEDDALNVKVVSRDFDKKLDEEATILNLNLTLEVSTIAYNPDDLKAAIAAIATTSSGTLQANQNDTEIIESSAKINKNTVTITGKARVKLLPKLNIDDLKTKIAGKSTKDARAQIKENADVTDVEIKFSPNLPLFNSIPKNSSKIKITLQAD